MADETKLRETREFMTTREVADYLRLKERRVYELVRRQEIPCTRVTGKWLFPRALVDLWLAEHAGGAARVPAPPVIAGSHDPLLDWAVKESGCGLALLPGGSLDGIKRFADGGAVAAGLHLIDGESGAFNLPALTGGLTGGLAGGLDGPALAGAGVMLLEWAWRQQGLVVAAGNPHGIATLGDLATLRGLKDKKLKIMGRQAAAGSHLLLADLLAREGLSFDDLEILDETARGETDLGLAVLEGRADAGLAIEAVARSLKLGFVPLLRERYDLLAHRRDVFEPPLAALFAFARGEAFAARAARMGGYDVSGLGTMHYNGP